MDIGVFFDLNAYQVLSFCRLLSVYLSVCFVYASVCVSVQLEMHSPGIRCKDTNYIIFYYLTFYVFFV